MRAVVLAMILVGCGPQAAFVSPADELGSNEGPLLGVDGRDSAERGCQLILRTAQRVVLNGGYETSCSTSGCFKVWQGTMDVSAQAVAEGAKPWVLYKSFDATAWSKVAGFRSSGAPTGFVRYVFRIEDHTVQDLATEGAGLQLSPYLLTSTGARLFDHNRRPGDFEAYVLSASTGWDLADEAMVCRAPSRDQRSTDVAVTRVWNAQTVCFRHKTEGQNCSGGQIIDLKRCQMISLQPSGATFDCTQVYEQAAQTRLVTPLIVYGDKVDASQQQYYGEYFVRNGSFMKRIEAVVKVSALTAGSFRGIGFYVDALSYRYYLPVPAPRPATIFPFVSREALWATGEQVTLKDGAAGVVVQFSLPIQASEGGTSTVYGAYFRPYAEFEAGGEIFHNYDAVDRDYFVNFSTAFDRRGDVLR